MESDSTGQGQVDISAAGDAIDVSPLTASSSIMARPGASRLGTGYGGMYGSGMGGMGMSGMGGMGGMGMGGMGMGGMGMGGMGMGGVGMGGMGMAGMGMGGMPGQQGQPGGFRHSYQTVFSGFQNLLQMLYSGLGLFAFGKLFGSMVYKMVKAIATRFFRGTKYILSLIFLNRISIKVINGAIKRASTSGEATVGGIMAKALFTIGVLCMGAVWFLIRQDHLAEEEYRLRAMAAKRARERQQLQRQLNHMRYGYDSLETNMNGFGDLDRRTIYSKIDFDDSKRINAANEELSREELKAADPELSEIFEKARLEDEEEQKKLKAIDEDSDDDTEEITEDNKNLEENTENDKNAGNNQYKIRR